jgi:hypothetical protein
MSLNYLLGIFYNKYTKSFNLNVYNGIGIFSEIIFDFIYYNDNLKNFIDLQNVMNNFCGATTYHTLIIYIFIYKK